MFKDNIKKIIDQNDVISFDIFDTLLFRNIYQPTDIFKILEKEVLEKYGIEDFFDLRVSSEAESRTEENNKETSLDEIYAVLEKKIGEKADNIKEREIELELEFITANPFMKEIFDYAKNQEKTIVLISDMYLTYDIISQLLEKSGYDKVPLYISCQYHVNKGSTELYNLVWKKEKLDKDKWVHIGDNKVSDFEKAKEFGIDAIHYENIRNIDKLNEPKSIESCIMRGIQNNYAYNGNKIEYWNKFGVIYASPIYFGFTNWLFSLTKKEDNLFFLARDGYVIKKVYEMFLRNENIDIKTHYLYCSRKTFQIPAMLDKKFDLINFLTAFTEMYDFDVNIKTILKSFELDYDDYEDELRIFGFENGEDIVSRSNIYQVKKLLKYIYPDIESKIKDTKEKSLTYLGQEDFYNYEKVNIMDIGWGGSIQEALHDLTGKNIFGYYLGTINSKKANVKSNSIGFAFDESQPNKFYKKIFNYPMMYEFIFSAPHGTTLDFKMENDKVVPVLDKDEEYVKIANILQNSALNIIEQYMSFSKYFDNISVEDSISNYDQLISKRHYEDLIEFSKLSNSALYTNNKQTYIEIFDEEWIYKNHTEFSKKINKAYWKNSYLIKNVDNEEEWQKHNKKIRIFIKQKKADATKVKKGKKAKKKTKKQYVKEGIKNPSKVIKFLKRKIWYIKLGWTAFI